MWGMAEHSLEANLQKIKEGGFDHVEMGAPASAEDRDELKTLLAKYELGFIGQQWSRGKTLAEHTADLEAQVRANADMGAVLINSHTGKDHWDQADNLALVQKAHELEAELGVMITHEIHRGRMTFCSTHVMALLDADPTIKFTADFSHWCCVAESLLQDQLDRVERAMQRSYHVHARVGHEQGPQITHPLAPEWKRHVDAHFAWWDRIVELRQGRRGGITDDLSGIWSGYLHANDSIHQATGC